MVSCQTLLQRAYDRDSSCNGSLKEEISSILCRTVQKLASIGSHQVFVGCHHMLSCLKCLQDPGSGRFDASHDLDHKIYGVVLHNLFPVIRKNRRIVDLGCRFFQIPHQDLFNLYHSADFLLHLVPLLPENFVNAGSHSSQT